MKRYTVTIVDVTTDRAVHTVNVDKAAQIKRTISMLTGSPYHWQGKYAVYIRDNCKADPKNIDIDEWAEHLSQDDAVAYFGPRIKQGEQIKPMPAGVIAALAAARASLWDDWDRACNDGEVLRIRKYQRYTELLENIVTNNSWPAYADELSAVCEEMIAKTEMQAEWAATEATETSAMVVSAVISQQVKLYKQGLRELQPFIK